MKWIKSWRSALLDPRLWLGTGFGLAAGVIIASGLGFDKSDAARFLGALIGALIAVTGAISLHYMKEREERESKRDHLRHLIDMTRFFVMSAIKDFDEDDDLVTTIAAICSQARRTRRYAEAHEADDIQISSAQYFLEDLDTELFNVSEEIEDNEDARAHFKEGLGLFQGILTKALDVLDDDLPIVKRGERRSDKLLGKIKAP